jgi:hypothetical protein
MTEKLLIKFAVMKIFPQEKILLIIVNKYAQYEHIVFLKDVQIVTKII